MSWWIPLHLCILFSRPHAPPIYTLSLHDALPIFTGLWQVSGRSDMVGWKGLQLDREYVDRWSLSLEDRKSTRLNSSHLVISYAVFCLKKKNEYQLSIKFLITHNKVLKTQYIETM